MPHDDARAYRPPLDRCSAEWPSFHNVATEARRAALFRVTMLCIVAAGLRCSKPDEATKGRVRIADPSQLLVIREYPGYPGYPGPETQVSSGTVCAVWKDGRIVRRELADPAGASYTSGRLSAEQMDQLRAVIDCELLKKAAAESVLVVDAPSERLYIECAGSWLEIGESTPTAAGTTPVIHRIKKVLFSFVIPDAQLLKPAPPDVATQESREGP